MDKKRVWLPGAGGQLGNALTRHFGDHPEIKWIPTTRDQLNLNYEEDIRKFFALYRPDVVVNAAAFTHVDGAEVNHSDALQLNAKVPAILAELCADSGSVLIQISTDHIFGGDLSKSGEEAYSETDNPSPANYYGETKLQGEETIRETMERYYILRTAWLYSPYGHNFYKSIRRKALEGVPFRVVTDEIGSPSSAITLAETVVDFILRLGTEQEIPYGIYNCVNRGSVSRYEFARAILDLDPDTRELEILSCLQEDLQSAADRPKFASLSMHKMERYAPEVVKDWREALQEVYDTDIQDKR